MEIDDTLLTILGIAAGVLILSGWVEQIIKGYKTKSLKDVSKYLMIFISQPIAIGFPSRTFLRPTNFYSPHTP